MSYSGTMGYFPIASCTGIKSTDFHNCRSVHLEMHFANMTLYVVVTISCPNATVVSRRNIGFLVQHMRFV